MAAGMKFLLTGAGGLLGQTLQDHCPSGCELVALSHSDLDILDANATQEALAFHKPDAVINCAAYTAVDLAETEVDLALALNATGPSHLARATASAEVLLVHLSTDFVFDGEKQSAYLETDTPSPLSVYGHTKAIGERKIREHQPNNHLIVRTAWLYGDRPPGFPHLLLRLAARGALRVVTDQRGSPTYAPHLAKGLFKAIGSRARGTLHLAGGGTATRHEWAVELMKALGQAVPVSEAVSADFPTAATRPSNSTLSSAHPADLTLPSWQNGVADFVRALEA